MKSVLVLCLFLVALAFLPNAYASDVQLFPKWNTSPPTFQVYVDQGSWQALIQSGLIEQGWQMWKQGFNFQYSYTADSSFRDNVVWFYCANAQSLADPNFGPSWWYSKTGFTLAQFCENGPSNAPAAAAWTLPHYVNGSTAGAMTCINYGGDMQFVAQHEQGHILGIKSDDSQCSLMYESLSSCRSLTPSADEISALSTLYATPIPEFSNTISAFGIVLLFASAVLMIHRRKQQ